MVTITFSVIASAFYCYAASSFSRFFFSVSFASSTNGPGITFVPLTISQALPMSSQNNSHLESSDFPIIGSLQFFDRCCIIIDMLHRVGFRLIFHYCTWAEVTLLYLHGFRNFCPSFLQIYISRRIWAHNLLDYMRC